MNPKKPKTAHSKADIDKLIRYLKEHPVEMPFEKPCIVDGVYGYQSEDTRAEDEQREWSLQNSIQRIRACCWWWNQSPSARSNAKLKI